MKQLRLIPLLLAVSTVAVVSMTAALPASAHGGFVTISNFGTRKCLQPVNGSLDQGAAIVQEPCDRSIAQGWAPISLGGTTFQYMNRLSGLCLDARGGATNGTPVQQWTCNSISNERWDAGEYLPDYVPPLISEVSGTHSHCLDVPQQQEVDGLAMQIFRCNRTIAQSWWIIPI